MIHKLIIKFIAKIYTKEFQLTKGVGTVLAMIPVVRKPSPKPLTTVEDAQESSSNVSALPQDVAARSDDLAQRFAQRRSRRGTQEQAVGQTNTTTTSTSNSNVEEEIDRTFANTSSEGASEDMYPMGPVNEAISVNRDVAVASETTQAAYAEVTRAIEESQAISFWDPLIGFFFGSTLAGLVTIGVAVGGTLFLLRGRLNRETVSRALSFFRNNRLLSSAIFGGGTTATTLISQNGSFNWAEFQRRVQLFITWASNQNISSPSAGLRVPTIFKAKKKSTGKEEKPDNDNDDKGNPFC